MDNVRTGKRFDEQVQLLTIDQAAARLAMSRPSVYRMMDSGQLAFVKLGRSRRVTLAAVAALVEQSTRGGVAGV